MKKYEINNFMKIFLNIWSFKIFVAPPAFPQPPVSP